MLIIILVKNTDPPPLLLRRSVNNFTGKLSYEIPKNLSPLVNIVLEIPPLF